MNKYIALFTYEGLYIAVNYSHSCEIVSEDTAKLLVNKAETKRGNVLLMREYTPKTVKRILNLSKDVEMLKELVHYEWHTMNPWPCICGRCND
jgi:hypothetical protein